MSAMLYHDVILKTSIKRFLITTMSFLMLGATPFSTTFASTVNQNQSPSHYIEIDIRDDGFTPNQLTSPLHHPLHLRIRNEGANVHEFAIPEYRIYTRNLRPGETSDIEFSPWEAGSFVMYSDPEADTHPEFAGRFMVLPTNDEK